MDWAKLPRPPRMVTLAMQDPKNQNFTSGKRLHPTNAYIRQTPTSGKRLHSTTHYTGCKCLHPADAECYATIMKLQKWTNRFAFELALKLEGSGEDVNEILERHNYDANAMLTFRSDPIFLKQVKAYRDEIREKGMTFRVKARAQAEELLTTSWLLIHNPEVSPAVKADLIKSTVKWAGLDTGPIEGTNDAGGVKITINLNPDSPSGNIIDATPHIPKLDRAS